MKHVDYAWKANTMENKLRQAGIEILGDMPWGTHFCLFYKDKAAKENKIYRKGGDFIYNYLFNW